MSDQSIAAPAPSTEEVGVRRAIRRVATVGLLAIVLGIVMQAAIVLAKLGAGGNFPGAQLVVDLTHGVTWAFLVCTGVGIGTAILKAKPLLVGLVGLVCAPLAMAFAKSSQKAMAEMIGLADQPGVLSLGAIGGLRAIEYGFLAWMLGRLAARGEERALPYFGWGGATGVVCGGAIAAIGYQVALSKGLSPAAPQVLGSIVNEVFFPLGCSAVIYVSQLVGRTSRLIPGI